MAKNTNRFGDEIKAAGSRHWLAAPDLDPSSTGAVPMNGIRDQSIGTSTDEKSVTDVKKMQIAATNLPVPLSMQHLREHGLAVRMQNGSKPVSSNALRYASLSLAPSTIESYDSAWRGVVARCAEWGVCPLPMTPSVVADIVAAMTDEWLEYSTIRCTLSVISKAHQLANLPNPAWDLEVQDVMRGVSRLIGVRSTHRKLAVTTDELRQISAIAATRPWPRGVQEWAVIAVTFFCGFRRGEAVGLDIDDLEFDPEKLTVHIIKSKRDQRGLGAEVVIERHPDDLSLCPVAAVESWLTVLGEKNGPVFRRIFPGNKLGNRLGARSVADYVKRFAPAMSLPSDKVAAHSLRAGCVTDLIEKGVDDVVVAAHVRHASLDSLSTYYRPRRRRLNITKALLS